MPDVRLIDANEVVTIQVFDEMTEEYEMQTMTIAEMIDRWSDEGCPPTIDAVPVVHGRWVHNDLGHTYCSKCHERLPFMHCYTEEPCSDYDEEWDEEIPETRYCPNCGARMDAADNNVGHKD